MGGLVVMLFCFVLDFEVFEYWVYFSMMLMIDEKVRD